MKDMSNTPLSQRPMGYALAVIGGTLGGPLGWVTSPLVLFVLNQVMPDKDGKTPNRFAAWALIGLLGAPLSLTPFLGNSPNTSMSEK